MGLFKNIGKGIKNAAKWTWKNKGKILKVGAIAAGSAITGGAVLGAVAPALGATLAGKLGSGIIGNIMGKATRSGIILNSKLKNTLLKNKLPNKKNDVAAVREHLRQMAEQGGKKILDSSSIGTNHGIIDTLTNKVPSILREAGNLFTGRADGTPYNPTGTSPEAKALAEAKAAASANSGVGGIASIMGMVTGMLGAKQATANKQGNNDSFFDKILAMKMLDSKPQEQAVEKESFFEKLLMMKELNKQDSPNIQVQNPAQQVAFAQLQADLQQSKLKTAVTNMSPMQKTLAIGGGIMGFILILFTLNKKQ